MLIVVIKAPALARSSSGSDSEADGEEELEVLMELEVGHAVRSSKAGKTVVSKACEETG